MKEAIGDAEKNKFSEFSKKVKTSLEDKLRNNPKMKAATDKQEQLQKTKDAFAAIAKSKEEQKEEPKAEETPAAEPF